jgi:hypothetical protein
MNTSEINHAPQRPTSVCADVIGVAANPAGRDQYKGHRHQAGCLSPALTLRRFPPETALSPLPDGPAEPSHRGVTEESEDIPEKPGPDV